MLRSSSKQSGKSHHCVIPCGMLVPVAVWQACELLYTCYLLTYLLAQATSLFSSIFDMH